jgi:hypothetical protein
MSPVSDVKRRRGTVSKGNRKAGSAEPECLSLLSFPLSLPYPQVPTAAVFQEPNWQEEGGYSEEPNQFHGSRLPGPFGPTSVAGVYISIWRRFLFASGYPPPTSAPWGLPGRSWRIAVNRVLRTLPTSPHCCDCRTPDPSVSRPAGLPGRDSAAPADCVNTVAINPRNCAHGTCPVPRT